MILRRADSKSWIHQNPQLGFLPAVSHLLISAKTERETPSKEVKGGREEGRIRRNTTKHEASRQEKGSELGYDFHVPTCPHLVTQK